MRKNAARFGPSFLTFATILVCLSSPAVQGLGQEVSTTTTESKSIPIEQLGTGIFSRFPFKVSLSLRVGYDDNITNSNFASQGSAYTNGSVSVTYDFGSPRTRLSLEAGAGGSYYWDTIQSVGANTNNYDINDHVSFSLTHKVTPRLTLSTQNYLTYQTEPDFSVSQGINRRGGNYLFTSDTFIGSYLWTPRFSTATSYTFTALNYDDMAVGQFSDRFDNTFGNEFRFLIWPTTSIVAEYRLQIVSYDHDSTRDSTSQFALAGFEHSFNPRLTVSLRGGAQFVEYDQGTNQNSPYFEGTLTYTVGKRTTVTWTDRYSIEQTDVALNQGRKTFRTGLSAKHDFTARITGSLSAYYTHDDYQGTNSPVGVSPGFTEESLDMALSLRYAITRYLGVEAGYNYTDISSDIPFRAYTRNRYWGGLNVTF
jgi:hypothetical protein